MTLPQLRLPVVSAGFAIDIPEPFFLRSLTINPVISDEEDGSSRIVRALWHTLSFKGRATNANTRQPIIWVELQIATDCKIQTPLPEIHILTSRGFGYKPTLREDWFRAELSRALSIINGTTLEQSPGSIEAAYGRGAAPIEDDSECPTKQNVRYVGVMRPKYKTDSTSSPNKALNCYFAAAICTDVKELDQDKGLRIALKALPVSRLTRCPVSETITISKGESVAFWIPLFYPSCLASLTGDERRFLALDIIWSKSSNLPMPEVEVLSFPRIANRFRVISTTPEFVVSPTLSNDPSVWTTHSEPTFALAAIKITPDEFENYCEVGIFLSLEDSEDKEQFQRHQVWISILVGAIASSFISTALSILVTSSPDMALFAIFISIAFALLSGALYLLLPRNPH